MFPHAWAGLSHALSRCVVREVVVVLPFVPVTATQARGDIRQAYSGSLMTSPLAFPALA